MMTGVEFQEVNLILQNANRGNLRDVSNIALSELTLHVPLFRLTIRILASLGRRNAIASFAESTSRADNAH